MEDLITIELPETTSKEDLEAIKSQIKVMSEIEDTGTLKDRSIDPTSLGLWIQLATGVLGAAGTGIPIIQKIMEMIRGKGIKGAKITFADGATLSIDEASVKDLERLIQAAKKPAKSKPAKKHG